MKAFPGPPMTLGNAATARVRFIVWCKDCRHQVEPDPAEMAERYGAETAVPDWAARLVCGQCGSRRGRYGAERGEAALKPGGNAGMTAPGARGGEASSQS